MARRAAARPRRCGRLPVFWRQSRGAFVSTAGTSRASPPISGPSASSFNPMPFFLTSPFSKTSPSGYGSRECRGRSWRIASGRASRRWVCLPSRRANPGNSRVASSSVWRSPGPWSWSQRSSCSTNPCPNLDARLRLEMRAELQRVQKETGVTMIFVTHDQAEALALADRIAVMHNGRIEQTGAPEEIDNRPNSAFVADFVGFENVFRVRAGELDTKTGRFALGGAIPCEAKGLAWRPSMVELPRSFRGKRARRVLRCGTRQYLWTRPSDPSRSKQAPTCRRTLSARTCAQTCPCRWQRPSSASDSSQWTPNSRQGGEAVSASFSRETGAPDEGHSGTGRSRRARLFAAARRGCCARRRAIRRPDCRGHAGRHDDGRIAGRRRRDRRSANRQRPCPRKASRRS